MKEKKAIRNYKKAARTAAEQVGAAVEMLEALANDETAAVGARDTADTAACFLHGALQTLGGSYEKSTPAPEFFEAYGLCITDEVSGALDDLKAVCHQLCALASDLYVFDIEGSHRGAAGGVTMEECRYKAVLHAKDILMTATTAIEGIMASLETARKDSAYEWANGD